MPILDEHGRDTRALRLMEEFRQERFAQFERDKIEVITSLDLTAWRTFVLRWADALGVKTAPPGGWENETVVLPIIHGARLTTRAIPPALKLASAQYYVAHGIPLPRGMSLREGVLHGAAYDTNISGDVGSKHLDS